MNRRHPSPTPSVPAPRGASLCPPRSDHFAYSDHLVLVRTDSLTHSTHLLPREEENGGGHGDRPASLSAARDRKCTTCGSLYSRENAFDSNPHYFDAPYHYSQGVKDRCLACWLGVSPRDLLEIALEVERDALEVEHWSQPDGELRVDTDRRDFRVEAGEEIRDALVYIGAELVRLRRSR